MCILSNLIYLSCIEFSVKEKLVFKWDKCLSFARQVITQFINVFAVYTQYILLAISPVTSRRNAISLFDSVWEELVSEQQLATLLSVMSLVIWPMSAVLPSPATYSALWRNPSICQWSVYCFSLQNYRKWAPRRLIGALWWSNMSYQSVSVKLSISFMMNEICVFIDMLVSFFPWMLTQLFAQCCRLCLFIIRFCPVAMEGLPQCNLAVARFGKFWLCGMKELILAGSHFHAIVIDDMIMYTSSVCVYGIQAPCAGGSGRM